MHFNKKQAAVNKESTIPTITELLFIQAINMFWSFDDCVKSEINITDIKHRKRLVDSFVNSIILHDDRIEFYFNYQKGANTLSISELEKSSDLLNSSPPYYVYKKRLYTLKPDFIGLFCYLQNGFWGLISADVNRDFCRCKEKWTHKNKI